jgi:hypothetical protein
MHIKLYLLSLFIAISFTAEGQHTKLEWSYLSTSTTDSITGIKPDTIYQVDNYLLRVIKTISLKQKASSQNIKDKSINISYVIKNFELINLETDSVYQFSIQEADTLHSQTYIYNVNDTNLGFDIIQLKQIGQRMISNNFVINSVKAIEYTKLVIKLNNSDYNLNMLIDKNIKSPFNISIRDNNADIISGALIELGTYQKDNTFKFKFAYIHNVPVEKKKLINRLKSMVNLF